MAKDDYNLNLQNKEIYYSGTKFQQRQFLEKEARTDMAAWLEVQENEKAALKRAKKKLLDNIKDDRAAVRDYINTLPPHPKGAVRDFLTEMSK